MILKICKLLLYYKSFQPIYSVKWKQAFQRCFYITIKKFVSFFFPVGVIPIVVKMVGSREELGEETARGDGGFGSTGV